MSHTPNQLCQKDKILNFQLSSIIQGKLQNSAFTPYSVPTSHTFFSAIKILRLCFVHANMLEFSQLCNNF